MRLRPERVGLLQSRGSGLPPASAALPLSPGMLGKRGYVDKPCNQSQKGLLLRAVALGQKLAEVHARNLTARWAIGLVNDNGAAVGRVAPQKPCIAVRTSIEFAAICHGLSP